MGRSVGGIRGSAFGTMATSAFGSSHRPATLRVAGKQKRDQKIYNRSVNDEGTEMCIEKSDLGCYLMDLGITGGVILRSACKSES